MSEFRTKALVNNFKLPFSLKRFCDSGRDCYKKEVTKESKELMTYICALLNSGGGILTLDFEKTFSCGEVNRCVKMITGLVHRMTSTTSTVFDFTVRESADKIVMSVKPSCRFVMLKSNLYLRDKWEVMSVPPAEPVEYIMKIIQGETETGHNTPLGSHCTNFIQDEDVGFGESRTVQLKVFTAGKDEDISKADRIVGENFRSFVSAFANLSGGHIYYGVKEDGIVTGETISEEEKEEIVAKVENAVSTVVWPDHIGGPKRGTHWEIFLEPVKSSKGDVIPHLSVIVIFIAQCPGGVFTEAPESYHVVNGQVKKMSLSEWLSYLQATTGSEFEWFINKDGTLKDVYDTTLKSFDWVENYKTGIVLTCKDGDVPSMGDLRKDISKDVLPCVEFAKSEQALTIKDDVESEDNGEIDDDGESEDDGGSDEDMSNISSDDEIDTKSQSDLEESDTNKGPTVSTLTSKETKGDLSWFRTTLYDENFDVKDEHVEFLSRLKWVQAFGIAGPNEECDTLHLVITCRSGEVPCMAELKKQFGKKIVFYVEFVPGTDDENFQFLVNENNHASASIHTSKSDQARYPMSGDGIYIHDDSPKRYGTIGVFACKDGNEIKHYATTCYHVCYNDRQKRLPKNQTRKHRILRQDSKNLCSSTRKSKYCYRPNRKNKQKEGPGGNKDAEKEEKEPEGKEIQEEEEKEKEEKTGDQIVNEENVGEGMEVEDKEESKEDKEEKKGKQEVEDRSKKKKPCKTVEIKGGVLGKFLWGTFGEFHDISVVEIFDRVPCVCRINDITCNRLATKREIDDELEKGDVIVKKTGCATGTTKGVLIKRGYFKERGRKGPHLKNGYLITDLAGSKSFARAGDSGSIVKLVMGEKNLPFAYLVGLSFEKIGRAKDPEQVYFCFDLSKSFEEFTKYEKENNSDILTKLCLTSCAGSPS